MRSYKNIFFNYNEIKLKMSHRRTCVRKLTIVKVIILSKGIYRDNSIIIKIIVAFFLEMDKPILNFINCKGS
jgi:hypothetical protein